MLMFSVGGLNIYISATKIIKLWTVNGSQKVHIRGIAYHRGLHFISHIITDDGEVWFHDGQLGANG
jgi:hypothetical protein